MGKHFGKAIRQDVLRSVKYLVIFRHRSKYPICVMCKFFSVSRSGYYEFIKRMDRPSPDEPLAQLIAECQAEPIKPKPAGELRCGLKR